MQVKKMINKVKTYNSISCIIQFKVKISILIQEYDKILKNKFLYLETSCC